MLPFDPSFGFSLKKGVVPVPPSALGFLSVPDPSSAPNAPSVPGTAGSPSVPDPPSATGFPSALDAPSVPGPPSPLGHGSPFGLHLFLLMHVEIKELTV